MANIFGIDFGSNTFKVYRDGKGIIYHQKNIIARKNKKTVVAYGDEAYEMQEKAPENIVITNPVRNGVITDIDNMQYMFNRIFKDMKVLSIPLPTMRPAFYVAVPFDITEVEKRAFYDVIESSTLRPGSVLLIEKSIADAVGMGLNVIGTKGLLVVDIGAQTTEVSVLSLGGIVLSKMIPVGGTNLDEAIRSQVKKHYNVHIGMKTAEQLKIDLGRTEGSGTERFVSYGRHVLTGLPTEIEVEEQVLMDAIIDQLMTIVDAIRIILEKTPPEISSDIKRTGIHLTGGSARIPDLKELLKIQTGLDTVIASNCDTSAVEGLGRIMESKELTKFFKASKKHKYS
ncbi:rod shape-determining protein [Anaerolentibacter hominis]|uniref:rod shape-determining protein n=1 Tax=Anaerolentibacter hominis TaxID=3079009 RepID=UPI0031B86DF2